MMIDSINYLQSCLQGWGIRRCDRGLLRHGKEQEGKVLTFIEHLLCAHTLEYSFSVSPSFSHHCSSRKNDIGVLKRLLFAGGALPRFQCSEGCREPHLSTT